MSVSISIDKPDVEVAVSAYDGYSEATGISAPLVMGDVQSQKGDASVAAGITASAVLGDAVSTKGDGSVAGGVVATAVAGDAQSQKGDTSQADGVSSAAVLGDVQSQKGDASVADGMSLPVVMGAVQTEHLKPDYRWQMPLPRQLAEDPEAFDPSTTAWATTTGATYAGTVQNVGPNGETAAQIDFDGTADAGLVQSLSSLSSHSPFTQGFYVRAVSGTQDVIPSHTDGGTVEDGSVTTLSTDWQWVDPTITPSGMLDQIGLRSDVAGFIYVLRAGLNRGSALEYSTRSAVPQEIPEVIQGADLQNGSDPGADTRDLDFGVGGNGVPYAVSDGDDESSAIAQSNLPDATWAYRFYLVDPGDSAYPITGQRVNYAALKYRNTNSADVFLVQTFEHDGDGVVSMNVPNDGTYGWKVVVFTLDRGNDSLRARFQGSTYELQISGDDVNPTNPWKPIRADYAGVRVSHLERHPVLTPAEAETVRQRLAQNPSDPIAPTEAWDLSAETSPHNLIRHSENLSEISEWDHDDDGSGFVNEISDTPPNIGRAWHVQATGRFTGGLKNIALSGVHTRTLYFKDSGSTGEVSFGGGSYWDNTVIDVPSATILSGNCTLREGGNGWYELSVTEDIPESVDDVDAMYIQNNNGGTLDIYLTGVQVTRGAQKFPPYAQTGSSIAFPQTAPALRQSANDLQLGSTDTADTNDGSWVAPIGMAEDGDDVLFAPAKRPKVTRIHRIKGTQPPLMGRSANGWKVTATDFVVEDTNGNTASSAHGETIADGSYHVLAVMVDTVAETVKLYVDASPTPAATVDLSQVGTLKSGDLNLLPSGGTLTHAPYMTRVLSGEEIAYVSQAIIDHPETAFPSYTTP